MLAVALEQSLADEVVEQRVSRTVGLLTEKHLHHPLEIETGSNYGSHQAGVLDIGSNGEDRSVRDRRFAK